MTVLRRWAMVSIVLSANSLQDKSVIFIWNERRPDSLFDRFPNELIGCVINARFHQNHVDCIHTQLRTSRLPVMRQVIEGIVYFLTSIWQNTYLIHNQYFSPLENSSCHTQELFFSDPIWDYRNGQSRGRLTQWRNSHPPLKQQSQGHGKR